MKSRTKLAIGLLSLLPITPVCAQEVSWYQVEVIVFDYSEPDLDKELWFENPGWPLHEDSIDPITATPEPAGNDIVDIDMTLQDATDPAVNNAGPRRIPYLELPPENLRLANDYRRLRLSSLYRPLLHVAWQQPGVSAGHIRYVHLESLANETVAEVAAGSDTMTEVMMEPAYQAPEPLFDGLVRLRVPNFLYVDVDFSYFPEDLEGILRQQLSQVGDQYAPMINPDVGYVRMRESRRIYITELNYFDHPLFGILLQVSRIETGE